MTTTGKVLSTDGRHLSVALSEDVSRELLQKRVNEVEIRLLDGRKISPTQRRKIFALIRDIALWSGHDPEDIRSFITWDFVGRHDMEPFSLSDVDMTTARLFIDYLIAFCFTRNVPTKEPLLDRTDDIGKYLYLCLEHRKCAVCNAPAQVHHVDRIGMGRDREHIVHVGLRAVALCPIHHEQAHRGEKAFFERYHIYGIKLDEYLCTRLNLKRT